MTRVLIAGLLGAIAMFVWTSIAHVVTPLGEIGLSQIPNEKSVLDPMHASMGEKSGIYFFPWMDVNDPDGMKKHEAAVQANPSGWIIYHPPGISTDMTPMLVQEFIKEFIQSLLAAFLLSLAMVAGYAMRVGFVVLIGVAATLTTNASYLIWYGFPLDYTLAQMFIEVVGYLAAGLAMAWYLKPRTA